MMMHKQPEAFHLTLSKQSKFIFENIIIPIYCILLH